MSNEIISTSVVTVGRLGSRVLSASTLDDDDIYNLKGQKLGSIKEIMLDINTGRVCYVVLSFGGFLSMGEKLFAADPTWEKKVHSYYGTQPITTF